MKTLRTIIPILALTLLAGGSVSAGGPLTADERNTLLAHLDETKAKLLAAVDGLTPEQWDFKPAPDRWSIAENVEHLSLTEGMLRGMVEQAASEAASAERLANARKEDLVLSVVVDRSNKVKTFEPLEPTGRWPSKAESLAAFKSERAATRAFAADGGDLRNHAIDHPLLKELDLYGSLLFISGHTERHVMQIEEVKASDGYPR